MSEPSSSGFVHSSFPPFGPLLINGKALGGVCLGKMVTFPKKIRSGFKLSLRKTFGWHHMQILQSMIRKHHLQQSSKLLLYYFTISFGKVHASPTQNNKKKIRFWLQLCAYSLYFTVWTALARTDSFLQNCTDRQRAQNHSQSFSVRTKGTKFMMIAYTWP